MDPVPEVKVVSARTKFPNTPESDALRYVPHVVTLSDGTTREVSASEPLHAMEVIRHALVQNIVNGTPLGRPKFTAEEAQQAIQARLDGAWEHPALLRFGPVSESTHKDTQAIAACANMNLKFVVQRWSQYKRATGAMTHDKQADREFPVWDAAQSYANTADSGLSGDTRYRYTLLPVLF
jgi:hypothetical protein